MVAGQDWGISLLLKHAEATDELYSSIILYTPLQTPLLYPKNDFPALLLTAIRNMVGVIYHISIDQRAQHNCTIL